MKTPESLQTLMDDGIIQEVVRPLMSGKEAQVYVVRVGGDECVAKVYKEADQRTFKHRASYTEGRRTRNSRDQRAVSKRTRHGRQRDEAAWRNAEVDTLYRLRAAGVRVAEPINFVDGVLVMELVRDAQGHPAPRLGDLAFEAGVAREIHQQLIREVVRMLCAGVIHGDLSEFNVLLGVAGPVLIDFPQSVDPARNQSARKLLLRDVENLHRFVGRFAPGLPRRPYAEEMWSLYESNRLRPDSELRGDYRAPAGRADTREVLALIADAEFDERMRRRARGVETPVEATGAPGRTVEAPPPRRQVVDFTKPARPEPAAAPPKKRRRRRRRKVGAEAGAETAARQGARSRTKPKDPKASAPGGAARAAQPAAGARGGSAPGAAPGGAPRARRRRRRPRRAAGSRETT